MNTTESCEELLFKMEQNLRNHFNSSTTATTGATTFKDEKQRQQEQQQQEPECEIHVDGLSDTDKQSHFDLQEHLDEICSLRELFVKQSQALAMLQLQQNEEHRHQHHRHQQEQQRYGCTTAGTSSLVHQNNEDDHLEGEPTVSAFNGCLEPEEDSVDENEMAYDESPQARRGKDSLNDKSFDETLDELTNTLDKSILETMREISPTCVSKFDFEDDSTHSAAYSDSVESGEYLDFGPEETDSAIQAAIDEIRKEASRMDLIMALDQIKTLQNELQLVTKALEERSTEVEDLQIRLKEVEGRVACVELERDLFQADATKLREDLKTCVDRMFDISEAAVANNASEEAWVEFPEGEDSSAAAETSFFVKSSPVPFVGRPGDNKVATRGIRRSWKKTREMDRDVNGDCAKSCPRLPFGAPVVCGTKPHIEPQESRTVLRRLPAFSDPGSNRYPPGRSSDSSLVVADAGAGAKTKRKTFRIVTTTTKEEEAARRRSKGCTDDRFRVVGNGSDVIDIFRGGTTPPRLRTSFEGSRVSSSLSSSNTPHQSIVPMEKTDTCRPIWKCRQRSSSSWSSSNSNSDKAVNNSHRRRHHHHRLNGEKQRRSNSSPVASSDVTREEKEDRMCGIFRRRHQSSAKRAAAMNNDISTMREQIEQLNVLMKTSLATSEKLRKRMSMISRYYEGIISKLQEQSSEMKAEKKRMEMDLGNRISVLEHDSRLASISLETKLRQKEEEIGMLKARLLQMEI